MGQHAGSMGPQRRTQFRDGAKTDLLTLPAFDQVEDASALIQQWEGRRPDLSRIDPQYPPNPWQNLDSLQADAYIPIHGNQRPCIPITAESRRLPLYVAHPREGHRD